MSANEISPAIWEKKKTSRRIFHDYFYYDMNQYQDLNYSIPKKPRGNNIRLMTFNIHFWTKPDSCESNYENILDVVGELNPDIIGMQEVLIPSPSSPNPGDISDRRGNIIKGAFNKFINLRKNGYTNYLVGASKAQCGEHTDFGNAILVKKTINKNVGDVSALKLKSPEEDRCAIFMEYVLDKTKIIIVVLHLDVYDTTGKLRKHQVQRILNLLPSDDTPVIIMGDFNCLREQDYDDEKGQIEWLEDNSQGFPDFETIKIIEDAGFNDAFVQNKTPINYTVWTGRRVDYVFTRNTSTILSIENTFVYYSSVSDHLPLIVDFKIL